MKSRTFAGWKYFIFIRITNNQIMGKVSVTEKPYRSVIKAISWRVIGTFDTVLISFIITGNVKFAVSIGGIELITKMVLYFFHERLWNKIKFGRVEKKEIDYQI
jgi:uncharacterized membrane protein